MKTTITRLAIGAALLVAGILSTRSPAAAQTIAPYFQSGTSGTHSFSFGNLGASRSFCSIAINPVGGGSIDLNAGSITQQDSTGLGGQKLGIVFYTPKGYVVGTDTGTVLVSAIYWFPCSNATAVSFTITASGTFNWSFIATTQAWPWTPLQGSAGALYSNTIADTLPAVAITTPTTTQLFAGNTNQATILYQINGIGTGTQTGAAAKAIMGTGATCGGSTVNIDAAAIAQTGNNQTPESQLWPVSGAGPQGTMQPLVIPPGFNVCIVSTGAISVTYQAVIAQPL